MATIYYEADTDPGALTGQKIAVLGSSFETSCRTPLAPYKGTANRTSTSAALSWERPL